MPDAVDEYLDNRGGSGAPSFKWSAIGDVVAGTVTGRRIVDHDDLQGEPTQSLVIDITADDGEEHTVWVKRGQMESALANTLKSAGSRLQAGDRLAIKYASDRPAKKAGHNPQKIYEVAYKKGNGVGAAAVAGDSEPAVAVADLI